MTLKEIRETLDNTKVYVNGKSREIQKKLFSFGYKWEYVYPTKVCHENHPFLFISKNGYLTYTNNMSYFVQHEYREISASKILSMEATEPSYRPFKTKDECWDEMQKHSPFGWLYHKDNNSYAPLIIAIENVTTNFEALFNHYRFADGTPFGILEN